MNRAIKLTSIIATILLQACATNVESCINLAPKGNWNVADKPGKEVSEQFGTYKEAASVVWFKNNAGEYGVCSFCDSSRRRASSFEVLQAGVGEQLMGVASCGPR